MTNTDNRLNSKGFYMKNNNQNGPKKIEQFRLPVDLAEQLEAFSAASGMDKTEIVINALKDQMKRGIHARLSSRLKAVEGLSEIGNVDKPVGREAVSEITGDPDESAGGASRGGNSVRIVGDRVESALDEKTKAKRAK